jgi:hypothetical protein
MKEDAHKKLYELRIKCDEVMKNISLKEDSLLKVKVDI